MEKLRLAVIGCNNMGSKHIKCLRENFAEEVEIAGILNRSSTRQKAEELNVYGFSSMDEINPESTDAAIIAAPAEFHKQISLELLERKIPCLLEKPMAVNEEECQEIIAMAQKTQTPLLIGHTENYNPAVIALKKELKTPIKSIKALRTSRNVGGKRTISVVPELMIHDIAIVSSLFPQDPDSIKVSKKAQYNWSEQAVVKMQYGQTEVSLESVIADVAIERYMEIIDIENNLYRIDFIERRLSKNGKILTEGGNSLACEQRNFLNMITQKEEAFVSQKQAMRNVSLCCAIEEKMAQSDIFQQKLIDCQKNCKK